jgi:hypothetical protein
MRSFPLSLLLLAAGCRTTVAPTDYSTDCTADTDCVVAIVGDLCEPCLPDTFSPALRTEGCGNGVNGAINARDAARYAADFSAIRRACLLPTRACPGICAAPVEAYCERGTCERRDAPRP